MLAGYSFSAAIAWAGCLCVPQKKHEKEFGGDVVFVRASEHSLTWTRGGSGGDQHGLPARLLRAIIAKRYLRTPFACKGTSSSWRDAQRFDVRTCNLTCASSLQIQGLVPRMADEFVVNHRGRDIGHDCGLEFCPGQDDGCSGRRC
jgi:hypothetical protein